MRMAAIDKDRALMARQYGQTGAFMTAQDARILRRAERTLNQWTERLCGWSTEYAALTLVRDDATGIPYHEVIYFPYTVRRPNESTGVHTFKTDRIKVRDLEAGALRRVAEVCLRNGLEYHYQKDPRGCSLYISRAGSGMGPTNYPGHVACYVGK